MIFNSDVWRPFSYKAPAKADVDLGTLAKRANNKIGLKKFMAGLYLKLIFCERDFFSFGIPLNPAEEKRIFH